MNFTHKCEIRDVLQMQNKMLLQILQTRLSPLEHDMLTGMIEGSQFTSLGMIEKIVDSNVTVKIPEAGPAVVCRPKGDSSTL
jgi:hypothetical protein